MGEGKSMCICWFRSKCSKMRDTPEAIETWGGPVIHRMFIIVYSWRNPTRLGDVENPARGVRGPDHLHVNVQWHWVEHEWLELIFQFRKSQELCTEILAKTLDIRVEKTWYGSSSHAQKGQGNCTADKVVQRFKEIGHLVFKSISALGRGILKQEKGKTSIHFNGDFFEHRTLVPNNAFYKSAHDGAEANWCYQFGSTEEEKGRASNLVDN